MPYVIDRANVQKENDIVQCSFTIKNNKIEYIYPHMENVRLIRMDFSPYLLTPGHVMLDFGLEKLPSFSDYMEYMKRLISKGCTTILVSVSVRYEAELKAKVKKIQHLMINSPIDYCIAVRVPMRALTPSFIRQCKRLRIPAVFLDMKEDEMYEVAWAWIRDAIYPYFLSIIPIWNDTYSKGKVKRLTEVWKVIMQEEHIPTVPYCPPTHEPLSLNIIRKLGISPLKGEIRIGGDIDYNLYPQKGVEFANFSEIQYDMDKPIITVHKGRNIKVGDEYLINPGYGERLTIKVPGFFTSSF